MSVLRELRRAAGLSFADWRYLIRATKELLSARVRFAITPSQIVVASLQQRSIDQCQQAHAHVREIDLPRLSWAISAAATRVPWRSDCLIQVMAADRWLMRHGVLGDFYIGVAKTESGDITAHAWLRCGNSVITGGASDMFSPLIAPPGIELEN